MKILAVDYGNSRTGLAISDYSEFLATPIKPQLQEKALVKVALKVSELAKTNHADMIVLGLPRNMDGTEGEQAQKCRKLGALLESMTGLHVRMWDERQTTITAATFLTETGTFGKKRKSVLDAVSASIILENYLTWRRNHPGEE